MNQIKFKFQGKEYPIPLSYFSAVQELPEKFNLHLTEIFTDQEKMMETMQRLVFDDLVCLKLMFHYMDEPHLEWGDFLKTAQEPDVRQFREDFWRAVEAFSGPLKKGILGQIWTEFKKEMKNVDVRELISTASLSDSNPEESTSGQEP